MTIGTLQETSLHAALKEWVARPGDALEAPVDGYLVDVVRGDRLIEIQTGNFSALKGKLARLLPRYHVRVIHPIAQEKWIYRVSAEGEALGRRKSPRRGRVEDVFRELVRLPHLAGDPHFSLEVVLVQEEQIWRDDGRGSWRRKKWSIADRRLLGVVGQVALAAPADYLALLPAGLDQPFTNRELAEALKAPAYLAGHMTYCLGKMGLLAPAGKKGRAYLYTRSDGF
ncbi:MAG: hypothetical protein L0322_30865 [Chloroflexi bacterium]|nr:hypothetical protein [Chloroflexota bacterium]